MEGGEPRAALELTTIDVLVRAGDQAAGQVAATMRSAEPKVAMCCACVLVCRMLGIPEPLSKADKDKARNAAIAGLCRTRRAGTFTARVTDRRAVGRRRRRRWASHAGHGRRAYLAFATMRSFCPSAPAAARDGGAEGSRRRTPH